MAAERMPDFKEINRLIESLEMLDRSFQRITAEYEGHEEKVRQACIPRPASGSARFRARGITRCMTSIRRRTGSCRILRGSARSRFPRSEVSSESF